MKTKTELLYSPDMEHILGRVEEMEEKGYAVRQMTLVSADYGTALFVVYEYEEGAIDGS